MPLGIHRLSRRDRRLGERAHRRLEAVAERDRVHGPEVVVHAAALRDHQLGVVGPDLGEPRPDRREVRRLLREREREQPLAPRAARLVLFQRSRTWLMARDATGAVTGRVCRRARSRGAGRRAASAGEQLDAVAVPVEGVEALVAREAVALAASRPRSRARPSRAPSASSSADASSSSAGWALRAGRTGPRRRRGSRRRRPPWRRTPGTTRRRGPQVGGLLDLGQAEPVGVEAAGVVLAAGRAGDLDVVEPHRAVAPHVEPAATREDPAEGQHDAVAAGGVRRPQPRA